MYVSLWSWTMKHILIEVKPDVGDSDSHWLMFDLSTEKHWKANLTLICPWNVPHSTEVDIHVVEKISFHLVFRKMCKDKNI